MHHADYGRDKNKPPNERSGGPDLPPESRDQSRDLRSFSFGKETSPQQDKVISRFLKPSSRHRRATFAQFQLLKDGYQSLLEAQLLPRVDDIHHGPHLRRYGVEILAGRSLGDGCCEILVAIRDEQHRYLWPAFSGRESRSCFSPRQFCGLVIRVPDPRSSPRGEMQRVAPLLSPDLREAELKRFENGDMDGVFGDCALWLIRDRSGADTDVSKVERAFGRSDIHSVFLVTDTHGKVRLFSPSNPDATERDRQFGGGTMFDPLAPFPHPSDSDPKSRVARSIPGAQIVSGFAQYHQKRGYKMLSLEDPQPWMEEFSSRIPALLSQYFGGCWQEGFHLGLEVMLRKQRGDLTTALCWVMDPEGEYRLPNKSGERELSYPLFAGVILEDFGQTSTSIKGICIPRPFLEAQLSCMAQRAADSVLCVPIEAAISRAMRRQGLNPGVITLSSVILSVDSGEGGLYSLLCIHNHGKHLVALHYDEASGTLNFDYSLKVAMYFPAVANGPRAQ